MEISEMLNAIFDLILGANPNITWHKYFVAIIAVASAIVKVLPTPPDEHKKTVYHRVYDALLFLSAHTERRKGAGRGK